MILQPGAHLRDHRTLYGHDGIYMGDGCAMQFGGGGLSDKARSCIHYVPLADFQKSGRATVIKHEDQDYAATIKRALGLIENPPPMPYDLIGHNCEHIAHWCATGNFNSQQVNGVLAVNTVGGVFFLLIEHPGAAWRVVVGLLSLLFSAIMVWLSGRGIRRFREHIEQIWPG